MKHSTCVYLIDGKQWLFLLRNKKENNPNRGKYIGVGGKCKIHETSEACARRETLEETGYIIDTLEYRGTIVFHIPHAEDEISDIYTCREFHGTMHECNEGTLVYVEESAIFSLNLWQGDRIFLERVLENAEPFSLEFTYNESNDLQKWTERNI